MVFFVEMAICNLKMCAAACVITFTNYVNSNFTLSPGIRSEQDIFIRLVNSATKQVSLSYLILLT